MAAVVVPIQLGLTAMVPHGAARWGLVAALALATALLLYGASTLGRLRWAVPALAVAGIPLPAAAVVGLAPGFLLVVTPLIAVLFGVYLVLAGPSAGPDCRYGARSRPAPWSSPGPWRPPSRSPDEPT